jgi:hypothetical protein
MKSVMARAATLRASRKFVTRTVALPTHREFQTGGSNKICPGLGGEQEHGGGYPPIG